MNSSSTNIDDNEASDPVQCVNADKVQITVSRTAIVNSHDTPENALQMTIQSNGIRSTAVIQPDEVQELCNALEVVNESIID